MMSRKRKPLTQLPVDNKNVNEKRKRRNSVSDISRGCDEFNNRLRSGTVQKMVLKNFMCHSFLEIHFTSNMSYVTGRNGSGKSAILTALVVGLGGRATLTNRGPNVKGFIKVGQNSAVIEITLNNNGIPGYQRHIYGNKIIITRNFTVNGSSTYKIKSETGKVISCQLKELHRITNTLNIQVDNPVCILNQDTSRNFLSTGDSKQRFTLFIKATRLDILHEECTNFFNNVNQSSECLQKKKAEFKQLKDEIKTLEAKLESRRSLDNLKEELKQLQCELLWAKVKDSEREQEQCQNAVSKLLKKCEELEELNNNHKSNISNITETINSIQQQLTEIQASIDTQDQSYKDKKRNLDHFNNNLNNKKREKGLLEKAIAAKIQDCKTLEKEIANSVENKTRIEQQKAERAKKLEILEEKLKNLDDVWQIKRTDLFQLRNHLIQKENECDNLQREIQQIDQNIAKNQSDIKMLNKEVDNQLLLYGPEMPRIVEAIKALKEKFINLPKGPIGAYITLKDKKWAVAAEGYLGPGFLKSFIVDNKNDNRLLMGILEKLNLRFGKPPVITTKFFNKVHDISRNLVKSVNGCVSLYEALIISDPVVANCLIDQKRPEGILLIPDYNKAIELMSERSRVPQNCKQGITVEGHIYYPVPRYKTYASSYHRARFLQVNVSDRIDYIKEQIKTLIDSKEVVSKQLNALKTDLNEQVEKRRELEGKIQKLDRAKKLLTEQLNHLRNAVDVEVADVQVLENELDEIKRDLTKKEASLENINKEINEINTQIGELKVTLNEFKQTSNKLKERITPLQKTIQEQTEQKNELTTNIEFTQRRLQDAKNKYNNSNKELENKQVIVNEQINRASAIGECPDNIRENMVVANEINQLKRRIRIAEADNENAEEISKKLEENAAKYKKSSDMLNVLYNDVKELHIAVEKRRRHYKSTEEHFVTLIKHSFEKMLEQRKFKGTMEINIEGKVLDLIVIPHETSNGYTTSTANLSGGERSFSTIAFLYSLWQCMDFPFYFLDEFDVYMDKLNRTKVMEVLIDHAKQKPNLQYVFLTPQDVSFINDKSVDIHRLEDPKRIGK